MSAAEVASPEIKANVVIAMLNVLDVSQIHPLPAVNA